MKQKLIRWFYNKFVMEIKEIQAELYKDRVFELPGFVFDMDESNIIRSFYEKNKISIKEIQAEAAKDKWLELTDFVFEINGKKYFKFTNSGDLPMKRYEALNISLIKLSKRLTDEETELLFSILKESLGEWVNATIHKKKVSNIQTAFFAIQEMESRQKNLMFHPELLLDLAAITIIREDENVFEINPVIHKEKIEAFRLWGGDEDFFIKCGVMAFLPSAEGLITKSKQLWEQHQEQIQLSLRTYQSILGSVRAESSATT